MADKKLNEVTKVTDMAYVPVIMADGSVGQISKADLASVVAGMIIPVDSAYVIANKRRLTSSDDLNDIEDGRYSFVNANVPANSIGSNATLFQFTTASRSDIYQFIFDFNGRCIYTRMYNATDGWSTWKILFSFT